MADSTRSNGGKASKPTSAKTKRTRGQKVRRFFKWATIGILSLVLIAAGGIGVLYATTDIPDPNGDFQTNTTTLYYNDGTTVLGTLSIQNRQSISYDEMPQSIKDAVVSAENRSFWTDPGISVSGILRAAWGLVSNQEITGGGSTITQQYIKILYLTSEQTFSRKLKEIVLAVKLNNERSKEQILEGYLNTIYFGRGAYGVEAAAHAWFNTSASELTVQQSAVLAAVLNAPAYFDPDGGDKNLQRLTERYHYVLDGMVEQGTITAAEREKYDDLPTFPDIPASSTYGGAKGFLIKMVESELSAAGMSDAQVYGGGLKITTTFDKTAQDAAVKVAESTVKTAAEAAGQNSSGLHAAIASVDTSNGEVIALYGGSDYVSNSRNWATTARPTASTFKAFATIAALRGGFTLNSTFRGSTFTPRGDSTSVKNASSINYGTVTLRQAVTDSINTAFVDMTQQLDDGPAQVVKAANDAGVPTGDGWDLNNRIALGTAEASPLNMANAFATLADDGTYHAAHVVREVKDAGDKVVYKPEVATKSDISADDARTVTQAMETVVEEGSGNTVDTSGHTAAGKTGTGAVEDKTVSSWLVAYTKQISTAVMFVAGDDGNGNLDDYAAPGDAWFYSSGYPADAWSEYMAVAMKDLPDEEFEAPSSSTRTSTRTAEPAQTRASTPSAAPTQTRTQTPTSTPTPEPTQSSTTAEPEPQPTRTPTQVEPSTEPTQAQPSPSTRPTASHS
ncbi:transglycosylase domain-containing protein [Propionicicella superfundia]|uniref:transglycosylase domain-containing protein n=1 Tax=Propionicicella superfundia TaxID=348582 RepID=UPI00040E4C13|nr:transglycosylase domain-containing protein [Propionicicella superfundia]